jgi:hypothetical protein
MAPRSTGGSRLGRYCVELQLELRRPGRTKRTSINLDPIARAGTDDQQLVVDQIPTGRVRA